MVSYALDPENPTGQYKAIVFQRRLGYDLDNYEPLLEQIEQLAIESDALPTKADQYGQRYQVDLTVVGAESQRAIVRTAWIVGPEAKDCARLISLYVRK